MSENTQKRKAPRSAFKPGVSGNPGGRPRSELNKVLANYLLKKSENGKTYTELLVVRLIEIAVGRGDMDAIEFIWDRLEGKVPLPMEHKGMMESGVIIPAILAMDKAELLEMVKRTQT